LESNLRLASNIKSHRESAGKADKQNQADKQDKTNTVHDGEAKVSKDEAPGQDAKFG